jgi:predicted dehydrogenase
MTRLPVGVIGVGRLGGLHARILSQMPECELVGVVDADRGRADEVAAAYGTRAFPGLEALLTDCAAVVVAVPTGDHYPVALSALRGDCSVLVEKPLTSSLAEADELIALAEARGRFLGVGHVERFNSAIRAALEYLGDARYVSSQRLAPFQPRGTDVPVVLDLMIHDIDLVLGLIDAPVCDVQAVGVPVLTGSVDMANARLTFENGAVADISASRVSVERTRNLRIFQSSAYVSLDLANGKGEVVRPRRGALSGLVDGEPVFPSVQSLEELVERIPLRGDEQEPLRLELEAFVAAVAGRASRCVTGRAGRAALEVALRIEHEIERFSHVTTRDS